MADPNKVKAIVQDHLNNCKLMQVATCKDSKPWIFCCWFSYDEDFSFYFISSDLRKHSQQIANNQNVAGSIVNPSMKNGVGQKVQGFFFEGVAKRIKEKEALPAYLNFVKRYPNLVKYMTLVDNKVQMKTSKLYKITPKTCVWFDEVNFKEEPRQEFRF